MDNESLRRLWLGDNDALGDLEKMIKDLPELPPEPDTTPGEEVEGDTLVFGQDLVPFYSDPEKQIDIFEDRKKDSNGKKLLGRDFLIEHGMVKFTVSVNTNVKQRTARELTLSFARSNACGTLDSYDDEIYGGEDIPLDDRNIFIANKDKTHNLYNISSNDLLRLTGNDLPRLLFPDSKIIDPQKFQNMTRANIRYKDSNQKQELWLAKKLELESFRKVTNDPISLQSVEMRTSPFLDGYIPYAFQYKYKKHFYDRADFRISMPLFYKWNANTLAFALDSHRTIEMNPRIRESSNPQSVADGINYLASFLLESDH